MTDIHFLALKDAYDTSLVGGKAGMLGRLIRAGVPVPDGWVISTQYLVSFLTGSGFLPGDYSGLVQLNSECVGKARTIIQTSAWTEEQLQELYQLFKKIELPMCLRSSAVSEDGEYGSYAGIYRSELNIRTFGEFLEAIREVWFSAFDGQAITYLQGIKHALPLMAIIIQPLSGVSCAGVAILENGHLQISAAFGLGLGVVSGRVPSDSYNLYPNDAHPEIIVGYKNACYLANPDSGFITEQDSILYPPKQTLLQVMETDDRHAIVKCRIEDGMASERVLDESRLGNLVQRIKKVACDVLQGGSWDFEWFFDISGRLYFTQARPLTVSFITYAEQMDRSGSYLKGQPIAPGTGTGRATFIRTDADLANVLEGDVLVMAYIPDYYMGVLSKASGVILKESSSLSHCAIVAREWKIPCVGGISPESISPKCIYTVNGWTGEVSIEEIANARGLHEIASPGINLLPWLIASSVLIFNNPARQRPVQNMLMPLYRERSQPDYGTITPFLDNRTEHGRICSALLSHLSAAGKEHQ
ncbi:PEP/pyruvate-binding domain-containing protein [Paenibacillus sp. MMS18-CY102]|uniref:PEP/pyruvate-binding domain-containing protein n=1 Tax=Paenibacillus sp. MMS18-CY102 TaxID=2682849 RepID=UPI003014669D